MPFPGIAVGDRRVFGREALEQPPPEKRIQGQERQRRMPLRRRNFARAGPEWVLMRSVGSGQEAGLTASHFRVT
jgi:hypothetical protein